VNRGSGWIGDMDYQEEGKEGKILIHQESTKEESKNKWDQKDKESGKK